MANAGDADAQTELALMYANGEGVPQDYGQAVAWYRKAAEQGHAAAQFNLGFAYSNGQGVPQDYAQAVAWTRKALEQGYAVAGWQGAGVSERRASVHLRGGHHCREASNTTLSG